MLFVYFHNTTFGAGRTPQSPDIWAQCQASRTPHPPHQAEIEAFPLDIKPESSMRPSTGCLFSIKNTLPTEQSTGCTKNYNSKTWVSSAPKHLGEVLHPCIQVLFRDSHHSWRAICYLLTYIFWWILFLNLLVCAKSKKYIYIYKIWI